MKIYYFYMLCTK